MTTDNLREGGHKGPSFSRRTFAKAAGVSAAALAIGASGASLAWFTGRDVKENKLSIAQNLNIRVVEPAWDPEYAKHLVPNQHIPKDPRIENLSDEFSGWMVVEIRVPTAVVSVFDEAEQKVLDPARTPLFSFMADPQWTLLQEFEDGDEDVYRFGWPETIPALGQTPPIFEEVVVANLVEAQGQSGSKTITATGYGIQSEGLSDITTAWDAYKKQNGIGDGAKGELYALTLSGSQPDEMHLVFARMSEEPSAGDSYETQQILQVVKEPEATSKLTSYGSKIKSVTTIDSVVPTTMKSWFYGMTECTEMDLSKLDTSKVEDASNTYNGCMTLKTITVGPDYEFQGTTPLTGSLPEAIWEDEEGNRYSEAQTPNGRVTLRREDTWEEANPGKVRYWAMYGSYTNATLVLGNCEAEPLRHERGYYGSNRYWYDRVSATDAGVEALRDSIPQTFDGLSIATDPYITTSGKPTKLAGYYDIPSGNGSGNPRFGDGVSGGPKVTKIVVVDEFVPEPNKPTTPRFDFLSAIWDGVGLGYSGVKDYLTVVDLSKMSLERFGEYDARISGSNIVELKIPKNWSLKCSTAIGNGAFSENKKLTMIDITGLDTSQNPHFDNMFAECPLLEEIIGIEEMDVSSGESFYQMFTTCRELKEMDLSKWKFDTTKQIIAADMFGFCLVLNCDCSMWPNVFYENSWTPITQRSQMANRAPGVKLWFE